MSLFKVQENYEGLQFSETHELTIYVDDISLGSVVVKALCYKPKGRGFDSR
jgi:hypothetical protein